MKVLITAFTPFNKSKNNYSLEVLNKIQAVDKTILDVCYDKCYNDLCIKNNLNSYDLIIAMGEARMRNEIMLEVTAKNISSCSIPDNNGVLKQNELIIEDAPSELNTLIDIDKLNDVIKFSYDAGKFVCNNLYYHLLFNFPTKSIFVHIPNCNDDELEYLKYADVINKIIEKLKKD